MQYGSDRSKADAQRPSTTSKGSVDSSPSSSASGFVDLTEAVRAMLPEREPSALQAFYDAYFDRLYGYIRRMVREDHLAEDLTQEVFMHLHQNFPSYDPTRALRPWVFTITTNKVRDYWRSKKHQTALREVHIEDDERGGFAVSKASAPDGDMIGRETSGAVAAAIAELPESMKAALMLRYYEGMSFEAIGEVLDRNETAVRKRYSRALEELRKSLAGTLGTDFGGAE